MQGFIGLFAVAILLLAACGSDGVGTNENSNQNAQPCGNGVIDGQEQCDLDELNGATCADVLPSTTGTLLCTDQCTFDTTGCVVDGTCGNGLIDGSEDCDLTNLGGATCADVLANSTGTLLCTGQCTFNLAGCTYGAVCGNGIHEFGENCDCGTDPMNVPGLCTDINGGANANCSLTCDRIDVCGDGLMSGTEECDCGDPAMIVTPPAGCTYFNGHVDGACSATCTEDT